MDSPAPLQGFSQASFYEKKATQLFTGNLEHFSSCAVDEYVPV